MFKQLIICWKMNKTMRSLLIELTLLLSYCEGFIVPKEVPELLGSIYSVIPPIKKGTDSRFGFGFRLGEHADFQTIIELGPQMYTKPLGKGADDDSGGSDTSKRMVNQPEYNRVIEPTHKKSDKWIFNWANEMKIKTTNYGAQPPQNTENDSFKSLFGPKNQFPIPTTSMMDPYSLRQLQQLYNNKRNEQPSEIADQPIGTLPSYSMEAHILAAAQLRRERQIKSDLMNVSLDD